MTEGPPPSAASSSKTTPQAKGSSTGQLPTTTALSSSPVVSNSNGTTLQQTYGVSTHWNSAWPFQHNGYTPPPASRTTTGSAQQTAFLSGSNPYAAHMYQPYAYNKSQSPKPAQPQPQLKANLSTYGQPTKTRLCTPPPPDPKTFKDWDAVVKKFLVKTKMTETLKGFESDILVLNAEWEQKSIPEALKEMVVDLQAILDRIAGKTKLDGNAMDIDSEVDIMGANEPDHGNLLEERKLKYVHLSNGAVPRSQSSINKSISQFLSRTRTRNDASNRAEFLYTLAEMKRTFAETEGTNGGENASNETAIASCARVDAKPIDRDKQMKYDIAKYGEGPLIKTVKPGIISPPLPDSSGPGDVPSRIQPFPKPLETPKDQDTTTKAQRKRKHILDSDEEEAETVSTKPSRKRKGKGKEKEKKRDTRDAVTCEPEEDADEKALSMATAEKHPGIDDRLENVEAHLAIRYVPTPPRTLLSRLVFLEEHIAKLEKEYPPWAALHFNQPNRGWPPPPRATPLIVPPHLRTFITTSPAPPSTSLSSPSTATSTTPTSTPANLSGNSSVVVKPKKAHSSLHKAVLERMEVQRARSEMGGKGGRD